jgi:uncharacterized protein
MSDQKRREVLTRRTFAAAFAAVSGASPALAAQQAAPAAAPNPNTSAPRRTGPPPEVPPFEAPLEFTRKDVAPKARPFPMTQVRLLPGIFADHLEWNRAYMSRLSADRLLYNFRQNAGLPVGSAAPLGGWERPADGRQGTELRGHFTGHFLSASANLFASTGDREAKAKADAMVAELAKCQAKLSGGYLSAFPTELFDRLDSGRNLPWAPFYTIHKIMAGLLDMYQYAGNKEALQTLEGMAKWADDWSGSKSGEHMQQILRTEFGGIAETLYDLAAITNNPQWAKAADRFTKNSFVNPLASRRDELRGLHVNTHVPQVIAAARRYEISGDMRFHDVADFFWYEVTTARSYVTTGTSNGETWQAQARKIGSELKLNTSTAECCCSYNMLKLTRHLYSWEPDPHYFDYYERCLLNMRIGTLLPGKGYSQYYASLYPGAWKTFGAEDQSFWCCTGTGVEEYAKLNDSIYWRDDEGLYVNLFVASELNWEEKGLKLRQDTKFPEQPGTQLTVTASRGAKIALRLRAPAWLRSAPAVKLNGKALEYSAAPGSYLVITRAWKAGDKIEMELPMRLTVEATPDMPQLQAFLYGPLALAGDLGSEGITESNIVGPQGPAIPRPRPANPNAAAQTQRPNSVPAIEIPTFKAAGDEPSTWIKPGSKPLTFRTTGQKQDVTLVPFNSLFGKRYSVYWEVS